MPPLQDLLNRITWDPEFGKDRFAIGYEDRLMAQETVVPFAAVRFDPERPGMLSVQQEDGSVAHIPLHRVRTVYKNGEAIWRRPARPPPMKVKNVMTPEPRTCVAKTLLRSNACARWH